MINSAMVNINILKKLLIPIASFIVFLSFASTSFASTLSLSPASTTIPQGSIVGVSVRLNTQGESINGVSAYLSYPKDLLEVASISYGSGAFAIAAENSYGGGSIRISRGSISGATGNVGVATINFRGKSLGTATVSFVSGSGAPKTSDSTDSLNLSGSTGGTFTIGPPKPIVSPQELAIKDVLISLISTNSATITWTTDIDSDSTVEYGLEENKYILESYDKTLVKEHKIVIGENLTAGETFHFRVKSKAATGEGAGKDMVFKLKGYSVKITVLDKEGSPTPNAEVTLYSSPVKQMTNEQGIAIFTDVSPSSHLVLVKANGLETSKEIDVKEDNLSEFTLTLSPTTTTGNDLLTIFYLSLAVIICLIALGIIVLRRRLASERELPPTSPKPNPGP